MVRLTPEDSSAEDSVVVRNSAVQGGDAVWEGLRVYDGTVFALDEHIDRLLDSAKVLLSPSPAPPRLSTRP